MPAEIIKHILTLSPCKNLLLFLLFLFPKIIFAQTDTVILSDSLPEEIIEKPVEEIPAPDVATTDEEKEKVYFLDKTYFIADSTIQQRSVPDSLVKKLKKEDAFWYADAEIKEEKEPELAGRNYTPLLQQKWFQTLIWLIIIGGFAAAIMWYLASSNVGLFRKKNTVIQSSGDEELIPEDIFAINYQKEIDKAESNGNFRLAIRLMFLRLLKDLAERNIIQYKQDKTNLDYLMQLHPTSYYENFFRITRDYEYSWYGKFDVGEAGYRIIQKDFKQMERQFS